MKNIAQYSKSMLVLFELRSCHSQDRVANRYMQNTNNTLIFNTLSSSHGDVMTELFSA